MKKTKDSVLFFLAVSVIVVISGCSKKELYDMAIDFERDKADLVFKKETLDSGPVSYLENKKEDDQEDVLLLHGFSGDKDNWLKFAAEIHDEYHLVIPDLLGHGESAGGEALDYSIRGQVKMLAAFLDHQKIRRVHLVGNSLGGAVAIRFTHDYPDRVISLTLIDSLGAVDASTLQKRLQVSNGKNRFLDVSSESEYREMLAFSMEKPPYIPGIFMELLLNKKMERNILEHTIFNQMLVDSDLRPLIPAIITPVLIMWGSKDRILLPEEGAYMHGIFQQSELFVLDGVGHVPILEEPEQSAGEFKRFIHRSKKLTVR